MSVVGVVLSFVQSCAFVIYVFRSKPVELDSGEALEGESPQVLEAPGDLDGGCINHTIHRRRNCTSNGVSRRHIMSPGPQADPISNFGAASSKTGKSPSQEAANLTVGIDFRDLPHQVADLEKETIQPEIPYPWAELDMMRPKNKTDPSFNDTMGNPEFYNQSSPSRAAESSNPSNQSNHQLGRSA